MAFTLQDNGYGSVDIGTNFGKSYSLKYSNLAEKAENYQAILNKETHLPKYQGQERLIAPEQVDEAKVWASRRAIKDMYTRPDVSASHKDTGDHLVGVVSDGEGVQSQELSIKEAKAISKEAKNGGFDPEKHGISKEVYLAEVRVDYLNQAVKAGLTAATITAVTQLVPELYKAIDYLIKHGEITLNQLKRTGCKVISTSGEAFLRGSIAYGVEMAIQEGLFGEGLKAVNPSVVGVAVTVILGTIKDSLLVAAGKMTSIEMGIQFVDTLVVSSGYLVSMKIGGVITQALFPELPGIGFAIGSLLGCSVAVVYNIGKKKLISFCVDTGFTCFGLGCIWKVSSYVQNGENDSGSSKEKKGLKRIGSLIIPGRDMPEIFQAAKTTLYYIPALVSLPVIFPGVKQILGRRDGVLGALLSKVKSNFLWGHSQILCKV